MKPIRRALIRIGKRDPNDKDRRGYYDWFYEKIFVVRAWYQRLRSVEREIERNLEHETLHHVLYNRVSLEACLKLDNLSFDWKPPLEFEPIKIEEIPNFCGVSC